MKNKKGVELSLNAVIIAVILLVVLVVIISIFTGTIGKIADKFNDQTTKAGEKSDNAMDGIGLFSCEEGDTKESGDTSYICRDGKWV